MSVILLVLSILVAGAGGVAIGFGVVINTLPIGDTLLISGTTGLVGGLLLMGVASAVNQLTQIAEAVKGGRAMARPSAVAETQRPIETPLQDARPVEFARTLEPKPVEARPVAEARATEGRPYVPPSRSSEPQLRPQALPIQEPSADLSSTAMERLRSTMVRPELRDRPVISEDVPLSPNGNGLSGPIEPVVDPRMPEPRNADLRQSDPRLPEPRLAEPRAASPRLPEFARGKPADPVAATASVAGQEPRLDFLFRSREASATPAESFDSMWPKRGGRSARAEPTRTESSRADIGARPEIGSRAAFGGGAPAATAVAESRRASAAPQANPAPASVPQATVDEARAVAILKSGVVDGMAYTLYADGSIEAQLPQGTVRFGSIAELRAHIENHS